MRATRSASFGRLAAVLRKPELTLAGYFEEWLDLCVTRGLRPATIESYRRQMHLLNSDVGETALRKVTVEQLNDLYHWLLREGRKDGNGGLSPRSVRYLHTLLRKAFADAIRRGYLRQNPAALADPPTVRAAKPPVFPTWNPEELGRFLESAKRDPHHAAFHLAATSGLRRGEVLGLRWCDIDFERQQLQVVQALIEVDHKIHLGPPKTEHSRRLIAIDTGTLAVLEAHRKRRERMMRSRGERLAPQALVFVRPDDLPIHPANFSYAFNRRVQLAGVTRIRFHDLRHTHATLALRAGVHPKVVSERLGHSTIAITLDIYSHCVPSLQREAAEAVAALLPV
jgi:integrase